MDSDLGAKVKKLRIAHGLTQEDVAKALDVTPGYISNVENGRNLMTLRMLSYYAELTGVSLEQKGIGMQKLLPIPSLEFTKNILICFCACI